MLIVSEIKRPDINNNNKNWVETEMRQRHFQLEKLAFPAEMQCEYCVVETAEKS